MVTNTYSADDADGLPIFRRLDITRDDAMAQAQAVANKQGSSAIVWNDATPWVEWLAVPEQELRTTTRLPALLWAL